MKDIRLNTSAYKIVEKNGPGVNLDAWLYKRLKFYGLTPINGCCKDKIFMLFSGVSIYDHKNENTYFDIEKWLKKILLEFGLVTQIDLDNLCCPTDKTLKIFKEFVYFGKDIKKDSLRQWLKNNLEQFNITYIDSCC